MGGRGVSLASVGVVVESGPTRQRPDERSPVTPLSDYLELLRDLVGGATRPTDFERRFLAMAKADAGNRPESEFIELQRLFGIVDAYVAVSSPCSATLRCCLMASRRIRPLGRIGWRASTAFVTATSRATTLADPPKIEASGVEPALPA